jgi:hypothetical protein
VLSVTTGGLLLRLERLRHKAPPNLAAATRGMTRTAISNARRAAEDISGAVAERRILMPSLEVVGAGDLTRLTSAECLQLLSTRSVGRLAYIARAGVPDIVPVNYEMDGETLMLRSGPGPKLQAAVRREVVAFEVDDIDEENHRGWSVVVTGVATQVLSPGTTPRGPSPWASGPRRHTIRVLPRRIDGRRLL